MRGLWRRSFAAGSRRARMTGVALPVVLMLVSMMLATTAAWFEISLAAARSASNMRGVLQAFHAADAALKLCARPIIAGTLGVSSDTLPQPAGPVTQAVFEQASIAPLPAWPGSIRPPRCLVQLLPVPARPDAAAWRLTAQGFGAAAESQVWLQLELVIEHDRVEPHWRRLATQPF
ncbi:pilus assembly PilX family protein [Paraburkholderia hayleyella]|uniref:pilus assembly PilX family protein n=1 Tax=Paraburkholderia hayleyella TaxID=2152889 RepID=UPI001FED1A4F|nr:PilX N-terminal domain-containing pilus assembly protein [Paraburkholderia hayleyella]